MNDPLIIIAIWSVLAIAISALVVMSRYPTKRERIATAALQGLLADPKDRSPETRNDETCYQATARLAVNHADALIKRLDETTEGMDAP